MGKDEKIVWVSLVNMALLATYGTVRWALPLDMGWLAGVMVGCTLATVILAALVMRK